MYSLGMYADAEAVAKLEQHANKSDAALKADTTFLDGTRWT